MWCPSPGADAPAKRPEDVCVSGKRMLLDTDSLAQQAMLGTTCCPSTVRSRTQRMLHLYHVGYPLSSSIHCTPGQPHGGHHCQSLLSSNQYSIRAGRCRKQTGSKCEWTGRPGLPPSHIRHGRCRPVSNRQPRPLHESRFAIFCRRKTIRWTQVFPSRRTHFSAVY